MKVYVLRFPQGGQLTISADDNRVQIASTIRDTRITIAVEADIAREIAFAITEIAEQVKVTN